jgi:hypothetical protein
MMGCKSLLVAERIASRMYFAAGDKRGSKDSNPRAEQRAAELPLPREREDSGRRKADCYGGDSDRQPRHEQRESGESKERARDAGKWLRVEQNFFP